jgi:putative transposase
MKFIPGNFYHVYNQGNNKQKLFESKPDDYLFFISLMRTHLVPQSNIIAYCLMPNHFHFLIQTDKRCEQALRIGHIVTNPISRGIQKILTTYTRTINKRSGRTGSIFRQRTHARCLETESRLIADNKIAQDDLMNCFLYIHRNPLDAFLVDDLSKWAFSSYLEYACLRNGTLVNKDIALEKGIYEPKYFRLQFVDFSK